MRRASRCSRTVIEGLLRYDVHGESRARRRRALGDRHERRARSGCATDALWSDGKPVTAHDFVFAWRTAVDPATASQYAFILYPVKNGEAINRGELPPTRSACAPSAIACSRSSSRTRSRTSTSSSRSQTYLPDPRRFLSRAATVATRPTPRTCSTTARSCITRWVHGASMRLEKNPTYWNRDCDLAQRHRHRVHHARRRRAPESVPRRPRRRRRLPAGRGARSGAAATLAAASLTTTAACGCCSSTIGRAGSRRTTTSAVRCSSRTIRPSSSTRC